LAESASTAALEIRHASSVVAVAASAGGVTALSGLIGSLPPDFPAAVLVVQHLDPRSPSFMAQILGRRTSLSVIDARDQQPIVRATIYVAPPDHHVRITPERTIALSQSAQVHHLRPSADVLFESVAAVFGARAIAVVLSGSGKDGADGVMKVKEAGGVVLVQDASAQFGSMPESAIRTGAVDRILDLSSLADALVNIVEGFDA
jgi:two-component system chemotaxis response regulator CheB